MTNLYRACGKYELKKLCCLLVEFVLFCKQLTIVLSSVKLCFRLEACHIHYVVLVILSSEAFCNIHSVRYKCACSGLSYKVCSWCVGCTIGQVVVCSWCVGCTVGQVLVCS
jgi:hypothetical protein